ncbi:hypothetical protein KVR01_000704 [Diaporthe batatas]|uniref:uncharacterized protein n=1 Tax=Diaporthe batatas TaxID=748121 RepID=UPI001D039C8E|nr:uncharacterized protein KVR01_000704 [Diaporthe batatas]KAG8169959.1 hypothetical protein KVR01_000704 [Diaporthe batatas]
MQLKLTLATSSICALSAGTVRVLAQDKSYCYDAAQYTTKFCDLGSRQDITQALEETACGPPTGDHTYACNAAKALNVPMPNNASRSFVFHFARLRYVGQDIPGAGPCGDVYLSRASCVYLGLAAIGACERGGEVTISETVPAGEEEGGEGEGRPVTAWLQVIPYV